MDSTKTYTPRARRARKATPAVWLGEWLARVVITGAGLGAIAAVAAVLLFLLWVAVPVFFTEFVWAEGRVLVFGTLKAAFVAMLFAVPLALLAAIFTSEYLHVQTRAAVKPALELMAGVPSVVLGLVAALALAPLVDRSLAAVLASLVTVPLAFLVGAHAWQFLPPRLGWLRSRWRFLFICLTLPLGLLAAPLAGWLMEAAFFAGDLRAWLTGASGSAAGGWILLLLPIGAVASVMLIGRYGGGWMRGRQRAASRRRAGLLALGTFAVGVALAAGLASLAALGLTQLGLDPRGSVLGPYSQGNALVVGFLMAFAIIPIIYAIAEDALTAVPADLRAGSLAAGATRWQTAARLIIPAARRGLCSAVMIGLGRAVGETMIVLMASGNSPIIDWSIFNGFRTLSAGIAADLPGAAVGGMPYRALFLAALVLFAVTFALNTLGEMVRMRFRRRAPQP